MPPFLPAVRSGPGGQSVVAGRPSALHDNAVFTHPPKAAAAA
jgi:hypothetical protein